MNSDFATRALVVSGAISAWTGETLLIQNGMVQNWVRSYQHAHPLAQMVVNEIGAANDAFTVHGVALSQTIVAGATFPHYSSQQAYKVWQNTIDRQIPYELLELQDTNTAAIYHAAKAGRMTEAVSLMVSQLLTPEKQTSTHLSKLPTPENDADLRQQMQNLGILSPIEAAPSHLAPTILFDTEKTSTNMVIAHKR